MRFSVSSRGLEIAQVGIEVRGSSREDAPVSTIFLRPAISADAKRVADVYLASRKAFIARAPLIYTEAEVRNWIADHLIPSGGVTVAVEGERSRAVLGMMATSRTEDYGWIDQLYLHPKAVGRGYGRQLHDQAKAELGPPIRLYTFQFNKLSRRFYEREGFEAVEYGDGSRNEEGLPDVLYEWKG